MATDESQEATASRERPVVWKSGALLAVIAVAGVSLLAGVHLGTRDRIAEQERRAVAEQLAAVLPAHRHDNRLQQDVIELEDPQAFPGSGTIRVYRGRRDGRPAGLVMEVTAPDGYNGDIVLLVGVLPDGTLSGVRVASHRETPGLGDPIEARRSDWILAFTGRSLGDPPADRWAVRRDGGDFDQLSGATITPRAVVRAVRRALEYHQRHGAALYAVADREGTP